MPRIFFTKLTLIFILTSSQAYALKTTEQLLKSGNNQKIGMEIADEFDDRDLGFISQISTMRMVLKNSYGGISERQMESRILERPEKEVGDKSMIIFHSPNDVSGTALLSFANILQDDDQWLYLPALKRVKRISSKNKSGSFLGSEFAYEDITGNEIGKYFWEFEKIEQCPNSKKTQCFKLTTKPKYEDSGYTKRTVWIDVINFTFDQIDYFDRKDSLIKTQYFNAYKQYLGKFWRADSWNVVNHQNGKSTILFFDNYKFKTDLTDDDLSTASLKRVR